MGSTNPNRRQLLTGATVIGSGALVATATGAAILAAPALGANSVSSTFAAKARTFRKATAAEAAFTDERLRPAYARLKEAERAWKAACDALPHVETKDRYVCHDGNLRTMSTAKDLRLARIFADEPAKNSDDFNAVCRELVELAKGREGEKQRLRTVYNIPKLERAAREVSEELERFGNAAALAQDAFLACPCVSPSELAEKIALIAEHELWEISEAQEAIIADTRRQAERA